MIRWPELEISELSKLCMKSTDRCELRGIGEGMAGGAGCEEIEGVDFDFEAEIAASSYVAVAEAVAS